MNKKIAFIFYLSAGLNLLLTGFLVFFILNKKPPLQIEKTVEPVIQSTTPQNALNNPVLAPTQIYTANVLTTSNATSYIPYTNNELNFKINYPNTLEKPSVAKIDKRKNRPDTAHVNFYYKGEREAWGKCVDEGRCLEGAPDYITISIFSNPQKLSPKDWVIQNAQTSYIYTNWDATFSNLDSLIIDGQEAVKYSWYGLGGADEFVLLNKNKDLVYRVSANYYEDEPLIRGDVLYIIDSFAFLR